MNVLPIQMTAMYKLHVLTQMVVLHVLAILDMKEMGKPLVQVNKPWEEKFNNSTGDNVLAGEHVN